MDFTKEAVIEKLEANIKGLSNLEFESNILLKSGFCSETFKEQIQFLNDHFDNMQIQMAVTLETVKKLPYMFLQEIYNNVLILESTIAYLRNVVDKENLRIFNL